MTSILLTGFQSFPATTDGRRQWQIGSLLFLAAYLTTASCFAEQETPNVLFLFTDDQAFDAVNALGWEELKTPNLDRLVHEGVTFTHAYNQGSWSGAVCVASRAMLITGKSLWNANREIPHLSQRYAEPGKSWPQRLNAAGYRTCMTGKWHVKLDPEVVFDHVRNVRPGMPQGALHTYDRPHKGKEDRFDPSDTTAAGFWAGGRHWSEVVADDAIQFMKESQTDDRPFFLYAAFNAPHDPRQSPVEYLALYPPDRIVTPRSFLPIYPYAEAMGAGQKLRDERLAPFPRTPYAVQVHRAEYAALISHLDAQIGRILTAVDRLGLSKSTRIVFTSDHGLAVGRHGLMGKQNMYDHSVRVPLVLSGPGLPQGKKVSERVYMQDIHPTVLAWAGAPTDDSDFRDLSPLLEGGADSSRNSIYGAYLDRQRMITAGDWKLIVYPTVPAVRLYHIVDDPNELSDLAGRAESRNVVGRLLEELQKQQAALGDSLELPEALLAEYRSE